MSAPRPFSKTNLGWLAAAYFFVLFNYPLVRAASTTMFMQSFGAKSSPYGWLVALVVLTLTVSICNRWQFKLGFRRLFGMFSLFSAAVIFAGWLLNDFGYSTGAFTIFTWKEVYIVVQVHLLLAYANSWLGRADFIKWIGPLAAVGSLGATLGGLCTTWISQNWGTDEVLLFSILFVAFPALFSRALDHIDLVQNTDKEVATPWKSLKGDVRRYVMMIAAVVALTQVIINIADFQFGIVFEQTIVDSAERTAYLGQVYAWTNALTLVLQFALLPIILRLLPEKALQLFVPLSYLLVFLFTLNGASMGLSMVSGFYIFLKSSDYSLFSAGKELLYHPLQAAQKYGAKYLTDMLVYRSSKAMIAFVLIYVQTPVILNGMIFVCLALWLGLIILIYRSQKKLFKPSVEQLRAEGL